MTKSKHTSNNNSNNENLENVRVRFAPSPTGFLHVGGARTALYNYLFAKKHGGTFVLRVEDTDEARSTTESLISMLDDLSWMELTWGEGPNPKTLEEKGEYGPYRQSDRKEIYFKHINALVDQGKAYYCFLTEAELDAQREEAKAKNEPFRPLSPYRDQTKEQAKEKIEQGEKPTIRFKNDHGEKLYTFSDLVRGEVSLPASMIGDFVIARSNGMPVYNFVCAVDDALMKISHVFRAEEHLNNTLRQLMVIEALGMTAPTYAHLSIMLGGDRQKLSKRHGAASLTDFKEKGFLPEALANFIALVGWSSPSGEEILSMEKMIDEFSTERLHSASAVFDQEKLTWMNAQYLREMTASDFFSKSKDYFKSDWKFPESLEWQEKSFAALKSSMETLTDAAPLYEMLKLGGDLNLNDQAKEVISWESTPKVLSVWKNLLEKADSEYINVEQIDDFINTVKAEAEVKGKFLFMPIRVASIGKAQGTEIKDLIPLIPVSELSLRVDKLLS